MDLQILLPFLTLISMIIVLISMICIYVEMRKIYKANLELHRKIKLRQLEQAYGKYPTISGKSLLATPFRPKYKGDPFRTKPDF